MINIILIIFAIFIFIKIILFILYKKKNNILYKDVSDLLQNIGVLVAIAGVIITYIQTNESLNLTKISLISSDSASIESKKVSQQTINLLDSISLSSSGLRSNLDSISNKIEELPKLIDNISKSIMDLNKISKEHEEITLKEYQRKPILRIFIDCKNPDKINEIYIENEGDLDAQVTFFSLELDGYFESRESNFTIPQKGIYKIFNNILNLDSRKYVDGNFVINYTSKNGNGGNLVGEKIFCDR